MRLIGINGFRGAGKDSTFEAIKSVQRNQGLSVERRAFADNLKIMAMAALGYIGPDHVLLDDAELFKQQGWVSAARSLSEVGSHLTGRQYIVNYGQHARRVFGEDFWVDQILPRGHLNFTNVWGWPNERPSIGCVTDVRMPNEALRVREFGGEIWQVVRSDVESDGQDTEQALPADLVTRIIHNYGTLSKLTDSVTLALSA